MIMSTNSPYHPPNVSPSSPHTRHRTIQSFLLDLPTFHPSLLDLPTIHPMSLLDLPTIHPANEEQSTAVKYNGCVSSWTIAVVVHKPVQWDHYLTADKYLTLYLPPVSAKLPAFIL